MTTVLFWDIDGTLLTTGKAGVPAWEAAVREVTGREFELSSIRVPGLTDFQIAKKTFELLGVDADESTLHRMVRRYEELLPEYLPLKQGRVLPNVREILEALRARDDVRSFLLTGNTRGGARAKLTHYDLLKYFVRPASADPAHGDGSAGRLPVPEGAFAEDTGARATIAARALELARRAAPVADEKVLVIGDTPHDIECANAIGARTIAVATGGYTREELAPHHAWRIVDELPAVDEFLALIDVGLQPPVAAGEGQSARYETARAGEARRG
jgi:phosphoglycolate phosphatase-like HAD superfamily hydrolase